MLVPNRASIFQEWSHQPLVSVSLTFWGHDIRLCLKKPRVLFAFVQTLLTWVFHFKFLEIVTPRYLILSTFLRTVPSKAWTASIFFIYFLVSCIMLHFTGWNLIPHFQAHLPSWSNYAYRLIYEITFWQHFYHFSKINNKQIADVGLTLYKGVHGLHIFGNVRPTLGLRQIYEFGSDALMIVQSLLPIFKKTQQSHLASKPLPKCC